MTDDQRHARAPTEDLLLVEDVQVAPPLTAGQARALHRAGVLADNLAGLADARLRLEAAWSATLELVRTTFAAEQLDQRVGGEWSFIETLRHLVFVTDAWIGGGVLGGHNYHPLGLPPHFVDSGRDLGLDLDAAPDLDTVLDARRDRQRVMHDALATATDAGLTSPCIGRLDGFSQRGAFQAVIAEELFHHGFATRDLTALTPK